jgi:hypothetical protein
MELGAQGVFAQWSAASLAAGDTVSFRIGPTAAPVSAQTWALISLSFALVFAIGVSVYGGHRRHDLAPVREQIIEHIARLDLSHEAGQMDASEYFHQRGAALEQLAALDEVSSSISPSGPGGQAQGTGESDSSKR